MLLCFSPAPARAQVIKYNRSALEVKTAIGGSFFFGDLGGSQGARKDDFFDYDVQSLRPNISLGLKFNFTNRIALRSDVSFAQVHGSDAFSEDPGRFSRNLSFKSVVYALTLTPEIVIINLAHFGHNKMATSEVYAFGGIGIMKFNPKTELNGEWHELQPLGTEGQGLIPGTELYPLQSWILPIGVGYRKNIGEKNYLGIELSMRKSYTDYIDDVSGTYYQTDILREERGTTSAALSDRQLDGPATANSNRGNSSNNDNYGFIQITYSRAIGKQDANSTKIGHFFSNLKGSEKCPNFQ